MPDELILDEHEINMIDIVIPIDTPPENIYDEAMRQIKERMKKKDEDVKFSNEQEYIEAMNQLKKDYETFEKMNRKCKNEYRDLLKDVAQLYGLGEMMDHMSRTIDAPPQYITLSELLFSKLEEIVDERMIDPFFKVLNNL